ncbi:MAG: hypothetical protein Q8R28_19675 [Dehalococcoidia bacterium]|nr:hypothetical protein [Dehalococcoidia bacterium]
MSYLLTKAVAAEAVAMVRPWFEHLARTGGVRGPDLHVVVALRSSKRSGLQHAFREAILHEESWGDQKSWKHRYDLIARSKAEVSWRTGLSTRVVVFTRPWLLEEGDTRWWGSVVLGNIVVACSGVKPWHDEMISAAIAAACRAICLGRMHADLLPNQDFNFLGEEVPAEPAGPDEPIDCAASEMPGSPLPEDATPEEVDDQDPNILGDPTFGTRPRGAEKPPAARQRVIAIGPVTRVPPKPASGPGEYRVPPGSGT